MSHQPASRVLQDFIGEETARKPRIVRGKSQPKPETANELTRRIVKHIRENGHFAARINTTGIYDEQLRKYRPSGATLGVPDVIARSFDDFAKFYGNLTGPALD